MFPAPSGSICRLRFQEEILLRRVGKGFFENCSSVEIASNAVDTRYGIFLLKSAGMIAEGKDVERAHEGEAVPFLAARAFALKGEERTVFKIICSTEVFLPGSYIPCSAAR